MDTVPQSPESFAAHVERVAQALETKAAQAGESAPVSREAVREVIRSMAEQAPEYKPQPTTSNPQPTSVAAPVPVPVQVTGPTTQTIEVLPDYLRTEGADSDAQHKVEALVTEAFQHGLMHALRLAKSRSPLVEDAFHDALVDIVLPILKERHRL